MSNLSLNTLRERADRWHRAAQRFQSDPDNHWNLGFACGAEFHRLAAEIKSRFGISVYR